MKMKLIMIMGLVALGLGQVQAQETDTEIRLSESWNYHMADKGDNPGIASGATWLTRAVLRITGKQTVYECVGNIMPPNCHSVEPRESLGPCDVWATSFYTTWYDVPCPPTNTIHYVYWMRDCTRPGCTEATPEACYTQVGSWNTNNPSGNCDHGYTSSTNLAVTYPGCRNIVQQLMAGLPVDASELPDVSCPVQCNGCGFPAFDGSGRKFRNKTTVVSLNFDAPSGSCGARHTAFTYTENDAINIQNCTVQITGSGQGSGHADECDGRTCDCSYAISYSPGVGWTYTASCSDCQPTCGQCTDSQANFAFWWNINCGNYLWHCGTPSCSATQCVTVDNWTGNGTARKTTTVTLSNECL